LRLLKLNPGWMLSNAPYYGSIDSNSILPGATWRAAIGKTIRNHNEKRTPSEERVRLNLGDVTLARVGPRNQL
jgi:hypothetical protein